MINWMLSGTSPKNKDKVIVTCESCKNDREQLYIVAKRKPTHICSSCSLKKGDFKTGEIVEYKCIDCGKKQEQKYRPKRFNNWRCHHCAMVQGHKDGIFKIMPNKPSEEGKAKLSALAKQRWTDQEYRQKWKAARETTKEKRKETSKRQIS